jgi:hypothetical protein
MVNILMAKKSIIIILMLIAVIVSISGCITTKTASNGTFGEKTVSINNITIVNNVNASTYEYNGTNYYYIDGFLKNNNKYDAFNLKMKATVYDANNNVLGVNDTPYLSPKVIPAGGESEFYFEFSDPNNQTVRYDLQLISVKAEA